MLKELVYTVRDLHEYGVYRSWDANSPAAPTLTVPSGELCEYLNRRSGWLDLYVGSSSHYLPEALTIGALKAAISRATQHFERLGPRERKRWLEEHATLPHRQPADSIYPVIAMGAPELTADDSLRLADKMGRQYSPGVWGFEFDPVRVDVQEGFWGVPLLFGRAHDFRHSEECEVGLAEVIASPGAEMCLAIGLTGIRGFYEIATTAFKATARHISQLV